MKKFLSIVAVLVLLCSLSTAAFAEEAKAITLEDALALEEEAVASVSFAQGERAYSTEETSVIALFFEFADKINLEVRETEVHEDDGYVVTFAAKEGAQTTLRIAEDGCISIESGEKTAAYIAKEAPTLLGLMQIFMPEEDMLIKVSEWSRLAVERAFAEGFIPITLTVTDYTQPISREDFCELAMVLLLKTDSALQIAGGESPFADTTNEVVTALYNLGIIQGKSETEFAPQDFLTREEAATILYRMAELTKKSLPQSAYDESVPYYTDKAAISDWAFNAVFAMREMGIMQGVSETEFAPGGTYTVEQAVATMLRLFDAPAA